MKPAAWHRHPHVNQGLTAGDRVADRLRNVMASWPFIIGSLAYMGGWITVAKLRLAPIDNPQLTYLNLILSCAAALSSSVILLSQKRSDVIASEVAVHTQRNTDALRRQADEMLALQQRQCEQITLVKALQDTQLLILHQLQQQAAPGRPGAPGGTVEKEK